MSFTIDDLQADGFVGFVPLRAFEKPFVMGDGPDVEGVYAVLRESAVRPIFREDTHRRPRSKVYTAAQAEAEWVDGSQTLYIGKGPLRKPRNGRRQGLAQRIKEMRAHGHDGGANHYGGKLLWQIEDTDSLLIAWKVLLEGTADVVETELIQRFMAQDESGRTPYANISTKGLRRR